MNSAERVAARMQGLPVDRPPNFNIMMTFAAQYIGQPLNRYYQDYNVLCEANFAVQADFDLDILQAISDPYREAADFGAEVTFPENNLPMCIHPLLENPVALAQLPTLKPEEGWRMSDRLHAVRKMKEYAQSNIPVMGWVEGALAEAANLRGVSNVMTDVYDRPEWLHDLLEHCVELEIAFAKAQIEAGADIIGLGDAVASQISPRMYRKYALPYEQRIFEAVHDMGAIARLHICGDTSKILGDMVKSGADIIDIDWMVDMVQAAAVFRDGPAVCGNFDPVNVVLKGTPADVAAATQHCMREGGSRSISAAGCEIPRDTPIENLRAQSQALLES